MNNLKKKIKRLDAHMNATEHDIRERQEALNQSTEATRLLIGVLAGGLAAGVIMGKTFKLKTLIKTPFKLAGIATTTKLILDKFSPKKPS